MDELVKSGADRQAQACSKEQARGGLHKCAAQVSSP